MSFSSRDFGSEAPPPPLAPENPRPQKARAILGTLLAGIIALILIAIVLAIISTLGERRLALLQGPAVGVTITSHSTRATPGLLVPSPLQERASWKPSNPAEAPALVPPVPPLADAVPQPALPANPPPAPAPPTTRQFQQLVAALPFPRIHDALLWRPYSDPNPKQIRPPKATEDLAQMHQAGRLYPEAERVIAQERRPQQTLTQLRAQAVMARRNTATTQPGS